MSGGEKEAVAKLADKKQRRGGSGKRRLFVKEVIHELAGWAPYERRAIDMLKVDKRKGARWFLKKRLGTHRRAMLKLQKLEAVIHAEQLAHQHLHAHAHEHK